LHPGQVRFLREGHNKINILVPGNRWGKTTLMACKHIWKHFYKIGIPQGNQDAWLKTDYRTANIAPHSSLVEAVFNTVDQIMTSRYPIRLPDGYTVTNKCQIPWFYLKDSTTINPVHRQRFLYNSYLECRTIGATASDSLEGKPWAYISYDEGGRSDHLEDEVNGTLLARLFDWDGELDIPSTPHMKSYSILYHYKLYKDGLQHLNDTFTMEGSLRDNIFFPPEKIEAQYKLFENNPLKDQVLDGKFVFAGDNIFSPQLILDAQDASLNDGVLYEDGHTYVVATDTSIGSDDIVHTVIDTTNHPHRAVRIKGCKGNSKSPQMHLNDFIDLFSSYSNDDHTNIKHILETFNGESMRFYKDLPYWIQGLTKCYGTWQPGKVSLDNKNKERPKNNDIKKADVILAGVKQLAAHDLKIPENIEKLNMQLAVYREDDERLRQDYVISLCMAAWLATEGDAFLSNSLILIDM